MLALRRSVALVLSVIALSTVGKIFPGLVFASLALAFSIRPHRSMNWLDISLVIWCSLVLLTFNGGRLEAWLRVLQPLYALFPGLFPTLSLQVV